MDVLGIICFMFCVRGSGLRGDAKELWRSIKQGREQRVKLIFTRPPSHTLLSKLYDDAAVIVWACGYSTFPPPAFEHDGTPIG